MSFFDMFNILKKKDEVVAFQKQMQIPETGKVDDSTFRRLETEKEFNINKGDVVFLNKMPVVVPGCKVVQKPLPEKCFSVKKALREPQMIVVHWDVALSSESCWNVLKQRGISTHFSIDNDGTIFQLVDPQNVAWHCGPVSEDKKRLKEKGIVVPWNMSWNNLSIGIDISNAYYPKYGSWYKQNLKKDRPVIDSVCHKQKLNHLGYFPEQIVSFKALVDVLCNHFSIPFDFPKEKDRLCETYYPDACLGKFKGVLNHFNLTPNKIDCSGFPLAQVMEELKSENE